MRSTALLHPRFRTSVLPGRLRELQPERRDEGRLPEPEPAAARSWSRAAEDRICPPSVNEANFKKQSQAPATTEHKEYPGRCHFPGQDGWEEVADYILALDDRAREQRRADDGLDMRLTHIGGPTALIEVGGWRLLTDPTSIPPGQRY